MSRCKYAATIDTSKNQHMRYESDRLPDVTKKVRKQIALVHGNVIRTSLIEDGVFITEDYGRNDDNSNIYYQARIFVVRNGE